MHESRGERMDGGRTYSLSSLLANRLSHSSSHLSHHSKILVSQSSHLNNLFFSWTDEMCVFKLALLEKLASQILHFGLFSSWIEVVCFFKSEFRANLTSQMSQLYGFFLSWTIAICFALLPWLLNCRLQRLHWCFTFSCMDSTCFFKLDLRAEVYLHSAWIHLNDLQFFFGAWEISVGAHFVVPKYKRRRSSVAWIVMMRKSQLTNINQRIKST